MGVKVQVTRPTKMELTRLKRRLKLATRIQKIVKDRLSILVMEFMQTVRECASIKESLLDEFAEAYKGLSLSTGYHGYMNLEQELMVSEKDIRINAGTRNVAGVRMPIFEIEKSESLQAKSRPMIDTSSILDRSIELSQKCLETLIQLAELQNSLDLLGTEINKVKRVNNALEFIVIPGIDATIKYLTMKFEERDREEVARLKYVKQLIEKKEAYAF
ncbi:MAG: V-type ATP synthase subunit D [Deltaproteobacteria bacterium]|jgi:V/A-type H+-transporting ATPase subunit D|nr:V-type ATP synthase subunit D [Deltaproteobacteria bacterium]MBN2845312.1 V-type ATP synthase subunit D [Deltaproteobacteria bacterium]